MYWIKELVNKPLMSFSKEVSNSLLKINAISESNNSIILNDVSTIISAENSLKEMLITKSDNFFKNHLDFLINDLKDRTKALLLLQKEPFYYFCKGIVKFHNNLIIKIIVNPLEANYETITSIDKLSDYDKNQGFYLTFYGKNLSKHVNDCITPLILLFSGEFPKVKQYKTFNDISQEEKNNLTLINFDKPIPEGWYTEGPYFIDSKGNRYPDHPSINEFIFQYLNLTNLSIEEHNQKIEKLIKSMEI